MVEQPRACEKRWAYLSRYVANETLYELSYTPLFGTRRLARLANFSSRNADLYSSDEIVRPLKEIAPDFVHPPRSVVICKSTNNTPGNYEKRNQSRVFKVTDKTSITKGGNTASMKDITENEEVSGSYWKNADGTLEAETVTLGPAGKAKTSTASPAASPKASPSPKLRRERREHANRFIQAKRSTNPPSFQVA